MKNILNSFLFVLAALICFVSSADASSNKVHVVISHWTLKNKAQIYFVQRKEVPMLDVSILFRAGSIYDGKKFGLSSLTNELIGQGTKEMSVDEVLSHFENVGAEFNTFSNRDMAGVSVRTIAKKTVLDSVINTLRSVIEKPSFSQEAIGRKKQEALTKLALEDQNPWDIAKNNFYSILYHAYPYAHNPVGSQHSIQKLTRNDVEKFYHRYYTGKNTMMIMVGDITIKQAKKISALVVGKLKPGKTAKHFSMAKRSSKSVHESIHKPLRQTTIIAGQIGIAAKSPQYFPLLVGNAVLGGLPLSSILYKKIREEKGLVYFASSSFTPLKYRGPFAIGLQTKASNQNEALSILKSIVASYIKNGPTESELNAAKKNLVGRFPLSIASNKSIMQSLIKIAFYNYPLNFLDTYIKNVDAVSIKSVKRAFKKTINFNTFAYVSVGPKNKEEKH